jgi:CheY-like chemotaxis protein
VIRAPAAPAVDTSLAELGESELLRPWRAPLLLRRLGYGAEVACTGLEAIDALERSTYDVVLMDVQMPDMDGLEASTEIRARWPGRSPRIVAMTANAMADDRDRCMTAGMDDYVSKPIDPAALVEALERAIDG